MEKSHSMFTTYSFTIAKEVMIFLMLFNFSAHELM